MKSRVLFISVLFVISCTEPPHVVPQYTTFTGFDFTPYSEQGFLFTPDKYGGDYESIGIITMTYRPRAQLLPQEENKTDNPELAIIRKTGVGGAPVQPVEEWRYKNSPDEFLKQIYETCNLMGADALTQMNITSMQVPVIMDLNHPLTLPETTISGYAIKRIGAFK